MARARRTWWFLAASTAALVMAWSTTEAELRRPRDLHGEPHAGAQACQRCHPDHYASWRRTFHGRMTQPATAASVEADFGGATLRYFSVEARAERSADGEYWLRYEPGYGPAQGDRIVRTIGSRRYQQYLAERDGILVRLPWAWHIEDERWFHMNGAFLTPDPGAGRDGSLARGDFERHVTRWNDNCIFCHNVAPNPGQHAAGFDSEVAELGVACEACHGPAQEHQRINQNPLRRYRLHLSRHVDPTIVNPAKLSPERSADVCGRCHGQRKTDDIASFLQRGDPFVPGDDLAEYSAPLWRDTRLDGIEGVFEARFWRDGTARLTAYEYQGLLQSPCAQRGTLTCTTCHGMHEGDPRGQIRPKRRGAALCTDCHDTLRAAAAQREHARHDDTDSVQCADCHMPRLVYGVMDSHRSHRIETPDPARAQANDRPDACTQCHVQENRAWAIEATARLWGEAEAAPAAPPEVDDTWSQVELDLLAGDPVQRALAAASLGRGHAPDAESREHQTQLLLHVMEHERYPAVRRLAWRSLAQREELKSWPAWRAYRADEPLPARKLAVATLRDALGIRTPAAHRLEQIATLRAKAPQVEIHIGE